MYENILSAIGTKQLSSQDSVDNFRKFDDLSKQGITVQSLLDRIEELEHGAIPFDTMLEAVKGDESVKTAKSKMDRVMRTVLTEICMKDPRYSECARAYRDAVGKAYADKTSRESDKTD